MKTPFMICYETKWDAEHGVELLIEVIMIFMSIIIAIIIIHKSLRWMGWKILYSVSELHKWVKLLKSWIIIIWLSVSDIVMFIDQCFGLNIYPELSTNMSRLKSNAVNGSILVDALSDSVRSVEVKLIFCSDAMQVSVDYDKSKFPLLSIRTIVIPILLSSSLLPPYCSDWRRNIASKYLAIEL